MNTLNDHLKYYIGGRLYGFREEVYETYTVEVGQVDPDRYKKSNFLEEHKRTAKQVLKKFGRDLTVMFSGGTDSEAVLLGFLAIGHRPHCTFIYFKGDFNKQDYLEAKTITDKHGLELDVFEFDIIDFYKSGCAAELASQIQCRQIAYLSVMNAIRQHGRPAVMGGEFFMKRHIPFDSESEWIYCYRENEDASSIRFSAKYGIPVVNDWFCYTPEIMGYFLEHNLTQKLVNTKLNYKLTSVSSKNEILVDLIPGLTYKKKTHGFENLGAFNIETYNELKRTHPLRLEKSLDGIKLKDLIKQLGLEKNENIKIGYREYSGY